MRTRIITTDQWSEWNRKIFTEDTAAAVLGINREHPDYKTAVAILREMNIDCPLLILTARDYKKIFQDAENYEAPPCVQVFSHGHNTGHYTVDEIINQTKLTCDFIKDDLK